MTPRNPLLLLLDMDGTLTSKRSPWQFVHEQFGLWESHGKLLLAQYLAGTITHQQFCDEDARLWWEHGISLPRIEDTLRSIPAPEESIAFLRQVKSAGIRIAIISTGFVATAHAILERAGISPNEVEIAANSIVHRDGGLFPVLRVVENDEDLGKGAWALRFQKFHRLGPEDTASVGDSAADEPMFEQCGRYQKIPGPHVLREIPWLYLNEENP